MSFFFSSCLGTDPERELDFTEDAIQPPLRMKIASSLGVIGLLTKYYVEPRKKQMYRFQRTFLRVLSNDRCHIPFVYFPVVIPASSSIIIYCHGSGSTLNNIYQFAYELATTFNIAVLAYDYTGDGESEKQFMSYEQDLSLVLSWVIRKGYRMDRIVLAGFSLGSYSALCLEGVMPRLLISPVCGIMPFLEGEAKRFLGEKYDTVSKARKLKSPCLIFHCRQEMVHISHGQLLAEALRKDNECRVTFHTIENSLYQHRTAPSYLLTEKGRELVNDFLDFVKNDYNKYMNDKKSHELQRQLLHLVFYQTKLASAVEIEDFTTRL